METGSSRAGRCIHPSHGNLKGQFYILKSLFSPRRLLAMIIKELIQMRRDRMTFAIMFGLPIVQILLFGFVINSDPRHLPAAILLAYTCPELLTLLPSLKNSAS